MYTRGWWRTSGYVCTMVNAPSTPSRERIRTHIRTLARTKSIFTLEIIIRKIRMNNNNRISCCFDDGGKVCTYIIR